MATTFIMPTALHRAIVSAAYKQRGFSADEAEKGAKVAELASWHGIKTHNAIKALHLDEHFGSKAGGCKPGAEIEKLPSKYKAVQRWNANRKLGQAVAFDAMDDLHEARRRIRRRHRRGGQRVPLPLGRRLRHRRRATRATSPTPTAPPRSPRSCRLAASFRRSAPIRTPGAFPTTDAVGFPICIDWATSTVAMGRVQQFAREGKQLPPGWAVDKDGNPTTDPNAGRRPRPLRRTQGLRPGADRRARTARTSAARTPTLRNRWDQVKQHAGEKGTCAFFFQCIHPDAISGDDFAQGRSQSENVKAVVSDVLGHGNEKCMLPGQPEAMAAALSKKHGGLIFTQRKSMRSLQSQKKRA